ncbi:hypothetical protein CC86DRAFT_153599 [Ophiobolus disseminans]|uniref:Uncharacterized protein n=1 Tax=Ophiobolus disseminans TaxID=1469910 RepID=A0A6A6ZEZ5_9PLEO|nr:hypothetical protein CC86DRAFT_153599 [Ophiobolus disseminans]
MSPRIDSPFSDGIAHYEPLTSAQIYAVHADPQLWSLFCLSRLPEFAAWYDQAAANLDYTRYNYDLLSPGFGSILFGSQQPPTSNSGGGGEHNQQTADTEYGPFNEQFSMLPDSSGSFASDATEAIAYSGPPPARYNGPPQLPITNNLHHPVLSATRENTYVGPQ